MTSRGVNERKIIVPASVEQVWATLADPSALQWMVRDCAFSVAVPDTPAGVGARWCWFRLDFSGGLSGGVFETTLSEPPHRLTCIERGKAECSGRYDFRLSAQGEATAVQIERSAVLEHQGLSQRVVDRHMARLAEQLPLAVRGEVHPGPTDPYPLLTGVRKWHRHKTAETQVNAPADVVWTFVDGDARHVPDPSVVHGWQVHEGEDNELHYSVVRTSAGVLGPTVSRVVRLGQHHSLLRGAGIEEDHQLLPRANGVVLRSTFRWNRLRAYDSAVLNRLLREWQLRVKTAAESAEPDRPA
jgi:hypothetical protein